MPLRRGGIVLRVVLALLSAGLGFGVRYLAWMLGPVHAQSAFPDLPLVEVAGSRPAGGGAAMMAVLLSADGGWATLDRVAAAELSRAGIPVVGWNSLRYFLVRRTPEVVARDLARVMEGYGRRWGRPRVLLVGYSFGADVLPFAVNRLPPALRERVAGVVLLSLGPDADFVFHLRDWVETGVVGRYRPTLPQVRRLRELPLLCIEGTGDPSDVCGRIGTPNLTYLRHPDLRSQPERPRPPGGALDPGVAATGGDAGRWVAVAGRAAQGSSGGSPRRARRISSFSSFRCSRRSFRPSWSGGAARGGCPPRRPSDGPSSARGGRAA